MHDTLLIPDLFGYSLQNVVLQCLLKILFATKYYQNMQWSVAFPLTHKLSPQCKIMQTTSIWVWNTTKNIINLLFYAGHSNLVLRDLRTSTETVEKSLFLQLLFLYNTVSCSCVCSIAPSLNDSLHRTYLLLSISLLFCRHATIRWLDCHGDPSSTKCGR